MKLIFSLRANQDYLDILQYLDENFGIEKALLFEEQLKKKIKLLKQQSEMFGFFFDTNYRIGLIALILIR